MSLRRGVKIKLQTWMNIEHGFWKSELNECARRGRVCKHSGTGKARCGQLGKTNLMGNIKLFKKKNKLNSQKINENSVGCPQ